MITENTTWGDLRAIHKEAQKNPDIVYEDDFLNRPEVAAMSLGKLDSELFTPTENNYLPDFHLSVEDGSDEVSLLIKTDPETDTMYTREGGDWVPVEPIDTRPELDYTYVEVEGDATPIWDASNGSLTVYDFQAVLLDGI